VGREGVGKATDYDNEKKTRSSRAIVPSRIASSQCHHQEVVFFTHSARTT
jgi:hypothetical protein